MSRKYQVFTFAEAAGIWVPAGPSYRWRSDAEQALSLYRKAEIREVLV